WEDEPRKGLPCPAAGVSDQLDPQRLRRQMPAPVESSPSGRGFGPEPHRCSALDCGVCGAPAGAIEKELDRRDLDPVSEIRSETEPYSPNSVTDTARKKCAKPHHATAVMAVFCAQANSSSNPRIAST